MKLLFAGPSPYVRKVNMTAEVKGLSSEIELVASDAPGSDALRAQNPLGKIPVLLRDDGPAIFDSHVICEYLDSLNPNHPLFPREGAARWATLTMAAMADGMLDAALLLVYEGRYRPESMRVDAWVEMQQKKIDTALALLESSPPAWSSNPDYGHLTIAAALGYLDFRHGGRWREGHPNMVAWLDAFADAVPAFGMTMPADL